MKTHRELRRILARAAACVLERLASDEFDLRTQAQQMQQAGGMVLAELAEHDEMQRDVDAMAAGMKP